MDARFFLEEELRVVRSSLSLQVVNKPSGLKKSSDFKKIIDFGKKKVVSHWLLISWLPNDVSALRFGCTISRKVGSAVTRNRLKRWAREYFKNAFKNGFNPSVDLNLVFRPRDPGFYKDLPHQDFNDALDRFFKGAFKY